MNIVHLIKEEDIRKTLNMIVKIIRKHLNREYKVLLFGSWAKLNATPTSDIDIAIFGHNTVDDFTIAKIREEIDDLPTLRKIDVIDLHAADETFRENILRDAMVLD